MTTLNSKSKEGKTELAIPTLREVLRRDTPGFYTEYTDDTLLHTKERTKVSPGRISARVEADPFDLKDAGFSKEQVEFIQSTNINNLVLTTIQKIGYILKAYSYIHQNGHRTTWMEMMWTEDEFEQAVVELKNEIEKALAEQRDIKEKHANAIQKQQERVATMTPAETGHHYWPE
jgi:hypothetical protein